MNYFLCSAAVIEHMKPDEVSKPFKSGYEGDNDLHYVAVLDFQKVDDYYKTVIESFNEKSNVPDIDFWCRECVHGSMDASRMTLSGAKKLGLFVEIERKTDLTNERNRAMVIYNMAETFGCTPIELINKIA